MRKVKKFWNEHKDEIITGACVAGAMIGAALIGYSIPTKVTKEGKEFLCHAEKVMVGGTKYWPVYPEAIGEGGMISELCEGQKINVTGAIIFGNDVTD